jgi:hypothetical protein
MFAFPATIENVSLDVKIIEGHAWRRPCVKLVTEFTDDIAGNLGGDARKHLSSIKGGGADKVYVNIEALLAKADLQSAREKVTIGELKGRVAVLSAGKDGPVARLEFDFAYEDAAWAWLGRSAKEIIQVNLESLQGKIGAVG